jgi:hypothetical protein
MAKGDRRALQEAISQLEISFESCAMATFRYQSQYNSVYSKWLAYLKVNVDAVKTLDQIPCLPIRFFKTQDIRSEQGLPIQKVFESSRTTGQVPSRHTMFDLDWYDQVSIQAFQQQFGSLSHYAILGLLPSYQANPNSSLLHMVDWFMHNSNTTLSRYLSDADNLLFAIEAIASDGRKPLLFGVSYALLDIVVDDAKAANLPLLIIETGGMKGRGKELTRQELHAAILAKFPKAEIYSEYGMTELLSQAYTDKPGSEWFEFGHTAQALVRDMKDPLSYLTNGQRGGLNIIDLANIDSCAFIATDDLGEMRADGAFKVLGRADQSEVRGCNLLIAG